jgi:hypothetical protein
MHDCTCSVIRFARLLALFVESRDGAVHPVQPTLLKSIGGLTLLLVQDSGVDTRLDALFLHEQLCKRIAFYGRNRLHLAFIELSVSGRIGQLMDSAGKVVKQRRCHRALFRPYRSDLGDLSIAQLELTSYQTQRPPTMPSVTARAVSSEVRPRNSYDKLDYNQSNDCPKTFRFIGAPRKFMPEYSIQNKRVR